MLFHAGKIDKDQLEKSLQMQKEDQGYLGQIFYPMVTSVKKIYI